MNDFVRERRAEMSRIAEECRHMLLDQVMPFWSARIADKENGGYFTCFDRAGKLYDRRKYGWFLGRTLYTYAALCQLYGASDEWLEILQAGYVFIPKAALGDGRFAYLLSEDGRVIRGAESIFTDHFLVKGMLNCLAIPGIPTGEKKMEQVLTWLDLLLAHVKDPEVLRKECPDARFQKHAVNFMTLAVLLESGKLFGSAYHPLLREYVNRSLYQFASDDLGAPMEYIGKDGKALPEGPGRIVDAGHTMESLWFSMEASNLLSMPEWNARAGQVLDWVIIRCWDERFGGFIQHVDFEKGKPEDAFLVTDYDGTPVSWDCKIWWVQAEALIALCMSAVHNQSASHWKLFTELFGYVKERFADPETGEWYSFLHTDGSVLLGVPGSSHKGPYHVPRCLMMVSEVLRKAAES